ncbi:nickel pincer cofactor biosynthesis protein LarC [Candidatus Omnitrophota bacterium]
MQIAYFDCFSGISGDMVLGALIDAGLDLKQLKAELKKLKLPGYRIETEQVLRGGISGTKFNITTVKQTRKRNLRDILQLIEKSGLDSEIKKLGKNTFTELARIESQIHRKDINQIHFHELGALDSIVEIIGAFIAIKKLGIERVYSSKIHMGSGFLKCGHGTLPVPAPATLELLKGIPVYSQGIETELVTPTGASIVKAVAQGFGSLPQMKIAKIGYGAGEKELNIPNFLRISLGKLIEHQPDRDEIALVETNIDDLSPEVLEYTCEKLFSQGALDVFMTPIIMKKGRAASMLSVLSEPQKLDELLSVIFDETSTFGVRIQYLTRRKLLRKVVSIGTDFGKVEVKIGKIGQRIKTIAPEYESCKRIAKKKKVPLQAVYDQAKMLCSKKLKESGSNGSRTEKIL